MSIEPSPTGSGNCWRRALWRLAPGLARRRRRLPWRSCRVCRFPLPCRSDRRQASEIACRAATSHVRRGARGRPGARERSQLGTRSQRPAVDHFGKAVETGTRGSSAKEAAADVVLGRGLAATGHAANNFQILWDSVLSTYLCRALVTSSTSFKDKPTPNDPPDLWNTINASREATRMHDPRRVRASPG